MGILDGLQKFLSDNRGEGNFTQRLGLAGAQLQDIDDGGNRAAPMLAQQQKSRLSQAQVQQAQYLDELAQRIGVPARERLLMRVSPEKAAEVMAKNLEAYTLSEGQGRYVPGQEDQTQFQPRTIESGDQFFQTQQGGGLQPVLTRDPSFQEQTNRQQAEAMAQHQRELEAIQRGTLGVAQGRLGLARSKAAPGGAPAAASGGKKPWERDY